MPTHPARWGELRPQLLELLYTFDLRPQPGGDVNPDAPDWRDQYESAFGVGHYNERRTILEETIEYLADAPTDADAVLGVLVNARCKAQEAATDKEMDQMRAHAMREAEKLRDSLRVVLHRTLDLHRPNGVLIKNPLVERVQEVLDALDHYPFPFCSGSQHRPEAPDGSANRRRAAKKAGAQPQPWLAEAYKGLASAGVTERELQTEWLVAVGLLPYSARPHLV